MATVTTKHPDGSMTTEEINLENINLADYGETEITISDEASTKQESTANRWARVTKQMAEMLDRKTKEIPSYSPKKTSGMKAYRLEDRPTHDEPQHPNKEARDSMKLVQDTITEEGFII